uniref:Uncharacterized protein n=1 Tax=Strigamia maritima TaxID=126957 RepID=T1JN58_STRMM
MSKATKQSLERKKKWKRSNDSAHSETQLGGPESDSIDSQAFDQQQMAIQLQDKKQLEELIAPLFDPGIDELPLLPSITLCYKINNRADIDQQQMAIQLQDKKQLEELIAPLFDPGIDELPLLP